MDFHHFTRFISRPLYGHLNGVFNELDAVDDQTSQWARRGNVAAGSGSSKIKGFFVNRTFLYLTLLYLFSNSMGFFGLELEATGRFTLSGALSHPYIFTRQFLPGRLGFEGDITCLITVFASTSIFSSFAFTPPITREHRLIFDGEVLKLNGQKVDPQVAEAILAYRRSFRRVAAKFCLAYFAGAFAFFYVSVYLNNAYVLSGFSAVYWVAVFPTFVFTCAFGKVFCTAKFAAMWGFPAFLITSTRYIEMRQMAFTARLSTLRKSLTSPQAVAVPSRELFHRSWTAFSRLNGQISNLEGDILEYSRFWWPFLSLIFPSYIAELGYLFYIVAFNRSVPLLRKAFFFLPMPYFFALLYFIIYRCARIVKMNNRLLRENRRFRMALIQKFHYIPVSVLLKSELLLDSQRLHPFAFRYLANIRITPKTFETIISTMGIFCILVFKNPYLAIG